MIFRSTVISLEVPCLCTSPRDGFLLRPSSAGKSKDARPGPNCGILESRSMLRVKQGYDGDSFPHHDEYIFFITSFVIGKIAFENCLPCVEISSTY